MKKPLLVFRFEPKNRFSLAALFGSLHVEGLLNKVEVVVAHSEQAARKALSGRGGFLLHSFCTPDSPDWANELSVARSSLGASFMSVGGGPHPSGDPEGTIGMGYDLVFRGRAERSFPNFVRSLLEGQKPSPGTVYEEACDGSWEESLYISGLEGFFPVLEIQRGCPMRCNFCQAGRISSGAIGKRGGVRYRSLDSVRKYLRLRMKKGLTRVFFLTPSAFDYSPPETNGPLEGVESLLSMCREEGMRFVEYGIFPSEVRPARGTAGLFDVLARFASNRRVVIGAQSFSSEMLRRTARGHGVEEIVSTIKAAAERGFRPYVDVMFGLPGETRRDRRTTLDAMEGLFHSDGAYMQLHHYIPLAGTPWYHLDPEPLDPETIRRIERMERAGMTRGWWRKGPEIAASIARLRDTVRGKR